MSQWIQSQGAIAYLIPEPLDLAHAQARDLWPRAGSVTAAEFSRDLDGLVLQGGSDLSPESYGEKPLKPEWAGDRVRDLYEMELVRAFVAAGKPVLGICRGLQLLNVCYGGTLWQDISTQVEGALTHRNWEIYDRNQHTIELDPQGSLAGWLGVRATGGKWIATVNSVHHQAIRELGRGVRVEARSAIDGIVEAIRVEPGKKGAWVYGVQWHPEFQHGSRLLLSGDGLLKQFLARAAKSTRRVRK